MTPDEIEKDRAPTRDEIANGKNCLTNGYGFDCYPVRFLPYKPDGQRQMGRRGRWQQMNEYGGWGNCDDPDYIFPNPIDPIAIITENAALKQKIAELEMALRNIIGILDDPTGGSHVFDMQKASMVARDAFKRIRT